MTDKSCRLSRSLRPRKGRRRSLRAGSGGAAQHNGAPLHDRSLARAFVHLLPSFLPSICHPDSRVVYVSARISAKSNLSLSSIETPTDESFATRDERCRGLLCSIVSAVAPSISIPAVDTIHLRLCKSNRRRRDNNRVRWRSSQAGDQHFLVAGSSRRRSDLIRRTQRYRRRSDARRGRGRGERTPLGGCPTTTSGNNTSSPREQRSRKEAAPSV